MREDGAVVDSSKDGTGLVWRDQVVRHDMHLQKKAAGSSTKLAKVPFLITNVTAGEAHVAVTDRNGQLNTASGWRRHTAATNANDKLAEMDSIASSDVAEGAGVWFGLGEDGSTAGTSTSRSSSTRACWRATTSSPSRRWSARANVKHFSLPLVNQLTVYRRTRWC